MHPAHGLSRSATALAGFLTEMNELLRAVPRGTRAGVAEDGDADKPDAGETNAEVGEEAAGDDVEAPTPTPSG